uniref:Uncharacterized protein n=1 Tax=Rhizophora mucronata TaxID=61149 RepID=A0A2P2P2F9_RHIMU
MSGITITSFLTN